MNWTSSAGLISDIIGVLLLFKYGLPSKVEHSGGSIEVEEDTDQEFVMMKIKNRRERRSVKTS